MAWVSGAAGAPGAAGERCHAGWSSSDARGTSQGPGPCDAVMLVLRGHGMQERVWDRRGLQGRRWGGLGAEHARRLNIADAGWGWGAEGPSIRAGVLGQHLSSPQHRNHPSPLG